MKKPTYLVLFLLSITSLSLAQKTYVPDNNFEQALIDLGYDDVLDDSVLTANINTVTTLDVDSKNIRDLTGIEAFLSLKILKCGANRLTNINISNNTALEKLQCWDNLLASLDVSNNPFLLDLECSSNQITSLDISRNTKLSILICGNNKLTGLNISNNTFLTNLTCFFNQLTSLDVSKNTLLTYLVCSFNQLSQLDVSNCHAIKYIHCEQNKLTTINVTNVISLVNLTCFDNLLTSIDVSNNAKLVVLFCQVNQLTNIDVSDNTKLQLLNCGNNKLTGLCVKNGNNINFTEFNVQSNPDLTCIEVDNPAWSIANWPNKDATASYSENCSNSNAKTYVPDDNFEQALIHLGYDNVLDDYVTTDNIDNVTSLDVNSKNISDLTGIEAFIALTSLVCWGNQLTSLDVTKNTTLTYLSCSGNQLTSLDLSNNTLLTYLETGFNNLTNLNITNNVLLKYLTCFNNQLSSLNITNNTKLEVIGCENNQITNLDLTNKPKLNSLYCNDNQLSSLDLSNCPDLKYIHCEQNKLTHLDVSNCSLLLYIYCENNQLTHLDVATNTALGYIVCNNNQLIGLDFSNNNLLLAAHCNDNQLKSFNIKNGINNRMYEVLTYNNPNLTCIQVDNAAIAEAHWRGYTDPTASFSENCGSITGTDADGDGVGDGDDDFPNDPGKAFANYFPATGYGCLGFEDLWPGKGDYDFNDLVLDYRFKTITNASNKVVQIIQTFVVKASGAALKNGFGFNLPDANPALVNNLNVGGYDLRQGYVNLKSNGTESGQSKPTIIAFDNVFNLMPHPGSGVGVNTETASPFVPYDTLIITLTPNSLNYTMNDFSLETWNPFIIVNGERGKEVHLIDNPPTDLANRSYFGTWEDKSNPGTGKYYRTINGSPWAINIAEPFVWPLERVEIPQAYLHFLEWAKSSGAVYPDWYKNLSGYRNNDKLYIPR